MDSPNKDEQKANKGTQRKSSCLGRRVKIGIIAVIGVLVILGVAAILIYTGNNLFSTFTSL